VHGPSGCEVQLRKRRAPGRGVHNSIGRIKSGGDGLTGAQRPGSTRGLTGRTVLLMFSAQVVPSSDRKLSWACRHPLAGGWSPMLLRLLAGNPDIWLACWKASAGCRIAQRLTLGGYRDEEKWEEVQGAMIDRMIRLRAPPARHGTGRGRSPSADATARSCLPSPIPCRWGRADGTSAGRA
jgi:hypothetical protein